MIVVCLVFIFDLFSLNCHSVCQLCHAQHGVIFHHLQLIKTAQAAGLDVTQDANFNPSNCDQFWNPSIVDTTGVYVLLCVCLIKHIILDARWIEHMLIL